MSHVPDSRVDALSKRWPSVVAGVLATIVAGASSVSAQPKPAAEPKVHYEIEDLGPSATGQASNDHGVVVGSVVHSSGQKRPASWHRGVRTDLAMLPGHTLSVAVGVDDSGKTAVGYSVSGSLWTAVMWQNGQVTDLGKLGGDWSQALGISPDGGTIVGWSHNSSGRTQHAVTFDTNGITDLGPAPGGSVSRGHSVNNAGQMAAILTITGRHSRAGVYTPGKGFKALGTIGGLESFATSINRTGQVAGYADTGLIDPVSQRMFMHAVLWDDGVPTDLGLLPGMTEAGFAHLNDRGQVAGTCKRWKPSFKATGYLWENGSMLELNELLPAGSRWDLQWVNDINGHGDIVGRGTLNGVSHGFYLKRMP